MSAALQAAMQDRNQMDQLAGRENAGLRNERPNLTVTLDRRFPVLYFPALRIGPLNPGPAFSAPIFILYRRICSEIGFVSDTDPVRWKTVLAIELLVHGEACLG